MLKAASYSLYVLYAQLQNQDMNLQIMERGLLLLKSHIETFKKRCVLTTLCKLSLVQWKLPWRPPLLSDYLFKQPQFLSNPLYGGSTVLQAAYLSLMIPSILRAI